jgi:hypothetical protein
MVWFSKVSPYRLDKLLIDRVEVGQWSRERLTFFLGAQVMLLKISSSSSSGLTV